MRYAVVIERAGQNYSAHVPDLPGCIAAADTVKEVQVEIRDAIRFHIEGSRKMALRCANRVRAHRVRDGVE